jgi:hypothetical protein
MNEPVAWWDGKEPSVLGLSYFKNDYCPIPLYIHPADESFDRTASHMAGEYVSYSAKTLTDEEIGQIWKDCMESPYMQVSNPVGFARAILRKAQEK